MYRQHAETGQSCYTEQAVVKGPRVQLLTVKALAGSCEQVFNNCVEMKKQWQSLI